MAKPPKSHGRLSIRPTLKPRELMRTTPDLDSAWRARVITLFPDAFPGVLGHSLTGKALEQGLWALDTIDLRRFGRGKHRNVDDTPAGGGAGMVLRADVVDDAFEEAAHGVPQDPEVWPVLYLSPRGRPFDQEMAQSLSQSAGVTLLCGRFEGVDDRVLQARHVQEVSIGDYVLSGGELAAQVLIDAVVRLIPGVLGNHVSTEDESFSAGLLEHPQFTRPAVWKGMEIPSVLNSGHHGKVADWRRTAAEHLTQSRRPDLWQRYLKSKNKGS